MRFRCLLVAAATSCALLMPTAASSQAGAASVEEIASDAAYGLCPLFLAGTFPLTAPELEARGFSQTIETGSHPRFGAISMVTATRADGRIAFGGAPGKFCTVVIEGDRRTAALARLRETMAWTGLDFKAAPAPDASGSGMTVEAFKAPVEGQFLHVQLVRAEGPPPVVAAQLFATDE
jgi:hypothetical protein